MTKKSTSRKRKFGSEKGKYNVKGLTSINEFTSINEVPSAVPIYTLTKEEEDLKKNKIELENIRVKKEIEREKELKTKEEQIKKKEEKEATKIQRVFRQRKEREKDEEKYEKEIQEEKKESDRQKSKGELRAMEEVENDFYYSLKPSRDVNVVSKQLGRNIVNASVNKTYDILSLLNSIPEEKEDLEQSKIKAETKQAEAEAKQAEVEAKVREQEGKLAEAEAEQIKSGFGTELAKMEKDINEIVKKIKKDINHIQEKRQLINKKEKTVKQLVKRKGKRRKHIRNFGTTGWNEEEIRKYFNNMDDIKDSGQVHDKLSQINFFITKKKEELKTKEQEELLNEIKKEFQFNPTENEIYNLYIKIKILDSKINDKQKEIIEQEKRKRDFDSQILEDKKELAEINDANNILENDKIDTNIMKEGLRKTLSTLTNVIESFHSKLKTKCNEVKREIFGYKIGDLLNKGVVMDWYNFYINNDELKNFDETLYYKKLGINNKDLLKKLYLLLYQRIEENITIPIDETKSLLSNLEKINTDYNNKNEQKVNQNKEKVMMKNEDLNQHIIFSNNYAVTLKELKEVDMKNLENERKNLEAEIVRIKKRSTDFISNKDKRKKYLQYYDLTEEDVKNNKEALVEAIGKSDFSKVYQSMLDTKDESIIAQKFKYLWNGGDEEILKKIKDANFIEKVASIKLGYKGITIEDFVTFHETILQLLLKYFPVKNIINLATIVSVGAGKAEEQDVAHDNLKKLVEGENQLQLGALLQNINGLGPFYKVLHTSKENDKKKRIYDVEEDIERLKDPNSDVNHIIYAGYGFSGSGKTFTLIEGDDSILNQIKQKLENEITNVKAYSKYEEFNDEMCNDQARIIYKKKENIPLTENFATWDKNQDIVGFVKGINEERGKTQVGTESELFRRSIRKTPFNNESSRSHLFIDITFGNTDSPKTITILDMAGTEDADVIQNQYFETIENKILINIDQVDTKVQDLVQKINLVKPEAYSSQFKNTIMAQQVKDSKKAYNSLNNYLENSLKTSDENSLKTSDENSIKTSDEKSYKIEVEKWKELFNDPKYGIYKLSGITQGTSEYEDHEDFIKKYNYYQMLEIVNAVKILYDTLKRLQIGEDVKPVICRTKKDGSDLAKIKDAFPNEEKNKRPSGCGRFTSTGQLCYSFNDDRSTGSGAAVKKAYLGVKSELNKLFKKYLGTGYEIVNINKLEEPFNPYISSLCSTDVLHINEKKIYAVQRMHNIFLMKIKNLVQKINEIKKKYTEVYFKDEYEKHREIITNRKKKSKQYLEDFGVANQQAYINNIKTWIEKKNTWDKEIITKYHCPLRFQGNAINISIESLLSSLRTMNKNKVTELPNGFPEDTLINKVSNKNFVVFTNIRLDFTNDKKDKSKKDAFEKSLEFSHSLLWGDDKLNERRSKENVKPDSDKNVNKDVNDAIQNLEKYTRPNRKKELEKKSKLRQVRESLLGIMKTLIEKRKLYGNESTKNENWKKFVHLVQGTLKEEDFPTILNTVKNMKIMFLNEFAQHKMKGEGKKQKRNHKHFQADLTEFGNQAESFIKLFDYRKYTDETYYPPIATIFKFGKKRKKKVSKKTSTRSFRKRGRRRGPSETEIL